eukprot:GHVP01069240.1.p1 GENE.GHVP01069240.1~~GHVP01069240.1.p1  ORF type:complete len:152 (-),score=21.73 GHVP01069240.1:6-461(-)
MSYLHRMGIFIFKRDECIFNMSTDSSGKFSSIKDIDIIENIYGVTKALGKLVKKMLKSNLISYQTENNHISFSEIETGLMFVLVSSIDMNSNEKNEDIMDKIKELYFDHIKEMGYIGGIDELYDKEKRECILTRKIMDRLNGEKSINTKDG